MIGPAAGAPTQCLYGDVQMRSIVVRAAVKERLDRERGILG